MSDIRISLGAKDTASKVLQDVSKNVEQMAQRTSAAFKTVTAVAGPLIAVFAAIKIGGDVKASIDNSINAFNEQAKSIKSLSNALTTWNQNAGQTTQQLIAMSDAMENTYNISDELTKSTMAQAAQMGVGAGQMEEVMQMAIGLSKATGADLNSAMKSTTELMMGNVEAMSGMIPSLKMTANYYQQLAIVQSVAESGLVAQKEEANSLAGAYDRMANATTDFSQIIGSILAPVQQIAYEGFAILIETLNAAFGPALENAGKGFESFRDSIGAAAIWLGTTFVKSVTMIETLWNNMPTVFAIAGASVLLSLESMRADIEHLFTVVIPEYATWLYDNWTNILQDMANATISIFKNMWTNIEAFFTGGEMVSLLDGFEAKTSALPQIAARQASALEQELTGFISQSVESIAKEYQTKVDARIGAIQDAFKAKEVDTQDTEKIDMNKLRGLGGFMSKVGGMAGPNQAVESRILTRGETSQQNFMQQIANNTKQTADEVKKTNDENKYKTNQQTKTTEMVFVVPGGGK